MTSESAPLLEASVLAACGELDDSGWHSAAWSALGEMGVTALTVPEALGGGGATSADAAVVLLTLGSVGASVPIVETGMTAGWLLGRIPARLPAGIVTAAVAENMDVRATSDGWLVSGVARRVPWGRYAETLVLLTRAGDDWRVLVLPTAGLEIRQHVNIAGEPRDDVVVTRAIVPTADLHSIPGSADLADDFRRRGAFGRSLLMAGAAQGVYGHSARYAQERLQFGRPLAAMQAIQQMLGELAAEASAVTVAAEAAALALDRDPTQTWPLDAARVRITSAVRTITTLGHQIHGAIGFTNEHPLHRLTTRLWAWREEYGNQSTWSDALGTELARRDDLPLWPRITS
jgi:acyl-CoA dehydrogenase